MYQPSSFPDFSSKRTRSIAARYLFIALVPFLAFQTNVHAAIQICNQTNESVAYAQLVRGDTDAFSGTYRANGYFRLDAGACNDIYKPGGWFADAFVAILKKGSFGPSTLKYADFNMQTKGSSLSGMQRVRYEPGTEKFCLPSQPQFQFKVKYNALRSGDCRSDEDLIEFPIWVQSPGNIDGITILYFGNSVRITR